MELVNPLTSFTWTQPLDVVGVPMRGVAEKQGWSFSRAGFLAALDDSTLNADAVGRAVRQQLRPLSKPTLLKSRAEHSKGVVPDFPRYWIIEPTNICNRMCGFCPITVMERPGGFKGHMAWNVFMKLMAECGQHDVYGLSLYQLGESMFWKGADGDGHRLTIVDMVNAAKHVGKFKIVNISTNGDVTNMKSLLGSELDDLIVSIDGMTADVYDDNRPSTISGDAFAFHRTLERVGEFLSAKAESGQPKPYVRMQIINKQNTYSQVLPFIRYWIQQAGVDDVFVKNLDSMRPWLGSSVVSDEEDAIKAADVSALPCQHIEQIGSMTVDGTLNCCCHDAKTELTDGSHILATSFADWWRGPYMAQIRKDHRSGVFRKPCADCRERDPWLG